MFTKKQEEEHEKILDILLSTTDIEINQLYDVTVVATEIRYMIKYDRYCWKRDFKRLINEDFSHKGGINYLLKLGIPIYSKIKKLKL